jgi:hypothetical protein
MRNRKVFGKAPGESVEVQIGSDLDFHISTNGRLATGVRRDIREIRRTGSAPFYVHLGYQN